MKQIITGLALAALLAAVPGRVEAVVGNRGQQDQSTIATRRSCRMAA